MTVREGLPVTTVERTIAGLVDARTQLDHVGHVMRDAMRQTDLDSARLAELLAPLAERNGHTKGDGESLLRKILEATGLGYESLSAQIAATPGLGALVASKYLATNAAVDVSLNAGTEIEYQPSAELHAFEAQSLVKQATVMHQGAAQAER